MQSDSRAALRWRGLLIGGALLLPGCGIFRELGLGGDDPRWVERSYRAVTTSAVVRIAQTVLRDRYPIDDVDLEEGSVTTGWIYGSYAETTHQALRQRAMVETEVDDAVVTVRLRVQQETSESGGRMADASIDDWEPHDDDVVEARRLLMKLHVVLQGVAEPLPATGS